jgi:hypothetical protein
VKFAFAQHRSGPELETSTHQLLPVANATETLRTPGRGFSANARIQPKGLPCKWRVEYGTTSALGSVSAWRNLPGKLTAYYKETWDSTTGDTLCLWSAGKAPGRCSNPGGYLRLDMTAPVTSPDDDINHRDGVGDIHLGPYLHTGNPREGILTPKMGGIWTDFRGAVLSVKVKSSGWTSNSKPAHTWIQADCAPWVDRWAYADVNPRGANAGPYEAVNYAHTAVDHGPSIDNAANWTPLTWTLRNRTQDWTYAGKNAAQDKPGGSEGERYYYDELDKTLGKMNIDFFICNWFQTSSSSPATGVVDFDDFQVTYRNHNLCAASNGGALEVSPAGGTGTEYLTDGWRNAAAGGAGDWLSANNPTDPVEFEFSFATPVAVYFINIHNSVAYPSDEVEVELSSDGGANWTAADPVRPTMKLEASNTKGPNFRFIHFSAGGPAPDYEWVPLGSGMTNANRMKVTIISGHQSTKWGLGEIEAFGIGAVEQTEDAWYDVNMDVTGLTAGTYHYRVVAEASDGSSVYGPDQTVTVV